MRKLIFVIVLLAVIGSLGAVIAIGSIPQESDVSVRLGTDTAGIFLNLKNNGLLPDCVIGVSVYGEHDGKEFKLEAELHKTEMEGNIMRMVKVDRVCVGPLGEVKMRGVEGEGYHIMASGDVEHVEMFHVYLKFESGKILHFHIANPMVHMKEDHKH